MCETLISVSVDNLEMSLYLGFGRAKVYTSLMNGTQYTR